MIQDGDYVNLGDPLDSSRERYTKTSLKGQELVKGSMEVGLTDSTRRAGKLSTGGSGQQRYVRLGDKMDPRMIQKQLDDNLKRIARMARENKTMKFDTVVHHVVNNDRLVQCYSELKKDKACGIDEVTVEEYGKNLQVNLAELEFTLRAKRYKPKPVKKVEIPKPGKRGTRPLGIPTVEDKVVQLAVKKTVEAIFEQDFLDCSHGFRPDRSCHSAIKQLDDAVMHKDVNHIVEVDIEKFFDTVSHKWLWKFLSERIKDPRLLGIIWRILKAGVVEENGKVFRSNVGTPQGGVISPLLANIYLHYVIDLWFERRFKRNARGYVQLIRYCDDFVVVCESESDAEKFLIELEERLSKFGLRKSEEKTRKIKFGRRAWKRAKKTGNKVDSFDFLGFTHFCKTSRKGWFIMGHKTAKRSLARKLKEINTWLKKARGLGKPSKWWKTLVAKMRGHFNYFVINGNMISLKRFYNAVVRMCFKWMNRNGSNRKINWKKFLQFMLHNPLPSPKVYNPILYPVLRNGECAFEEPCVGKPQAGFCEGYHSE